MKKLLGLVACASIAATAPGAPPLDPAPVRWARSVAVDYSDLNLATPDGIAALDRRVRRIARGLCWRERVGPDPWATRALNRCVDEALDNARDQVASAILAHRQRLAVRR